MVLLGDEAPKFMSAFCTRQKRCGRVKLRWDFIKQGARGHEFRRLCENNNNIDDKKKYSTALENRRLEEGAPLSFQVCQRHPRFYGNILPHCCNLTTCPRTTSLSVCARFCFLKTSSLSFDSLWALKTHFLAGLSLHLRQTRA